MSSPDAPLPLREAFTVEAANAVSEGCLPGFLGLRFTLVEHGRVECRLDVEPHHLAPNGYLHAATAVALADTACGCGALRSLPEDGVGFTTIELKTNFIGTARAGAVACVATLVHGGRTTQVWDAMVRDEASGRAIALFRCTQMILHPRG